MSWLNNSLNTIKGQLTNLAQEVLADTAGPGDDEYRGDEVNTKTALELLTETQLQKEQLDKACEDKDREVRISNWKGRGIPHQMLLLLLFTLLLLLLSVAIVVAGLESVCVCVCGCLAACCSGIQCTCRTSCLRFLHTPNNLQPTEAATTTAAIEEKHLC